MRAKILLIEDDRILRTTIKDLLEVHDFEILEAGNGRDALSRIYDPSLDLIICDIMLPDFNGYNLLDIVKKNEVSFDIPFIFLSGRVSDDDVRYAMNNGADDYLKKPFTSKRLLETVESRISLRSKSFIYSNRKLLSIIDSNFNEDFLKTLSSIYNGAFTISSAIDIMNNLDFGEAINEIYLSSFRLYRNTKNLMLYAHFSKSDKLPQFSNTTPLFISDIVTQLVGIYNKMLPSGSKPIDAQIDFVPFPKYVNGRIITEFLQFIFSELIDNAIIHNSHDQPPIIKLIGYSNGLGFRTMNSVPCDFSFSFDKVQPFMKFGKANKGGSLGLGLFNCKQICDNLDFSLSVSVEGSFVQFELIVPY